ncbi:MAG: DUF4743 domain-containing protein [Alphaproteobacteria bacterium]
MPTPSGYARHFVACNQHDLSRFTPLYIGERRYGFVVNELAALLPRETGVFVPQGDGIALAPKFDDFATRSEALMLASRWIAARYGKPLRN